MISCKKASIIISKSMDQPLSLREQIALKFHLLICSYCKQFRQHLKIVRNFFALLNESSIFTTTIGNSALEKMKIRIKNKIREHVSQI